jgi:hypothetical protein
MKKNVGSLDKAVRVILALILFALGFFYQSWWGLIGILPLLTAFAGWCPAFFPFGISTCKTKPTENN